MAGGKVYDLEVFKKAYQLSLAVHKVSLGFPQIEQMGGVADQMRRASRGICSNLVEGLGRSTTTLLEKKRFLNIALGSCAELRLWCRYAFDFGYIDKPLYEGWRDGYDEVGRMLHGLVKRQVVSKPELLKP